MLQPPNDRLGFISAAGAALAAVFLVAIVGWIALAGATPFSAGQLNGVAGGRTLGGVTSHAQLGNRCEACHTAPWSGQTMADRCLACHADVNAQVQARTGLHGRLAWSSSGPTCRGCHPDHRGADATLTVVDARSFPHDLTGYSLAGHQRTSSGAAVTCAGCHPSGLGRFDGATCASCHTKLNPKFMRQHVTTFGAKCMACHSGADPFGTNFDHNTLAFPLIGKHAQASCVSCHANGGSLEALRATPKDCYACHAKNDRHKGSFGKNCGQCHSTNGWTDATFDHSIFPLDHGADEQKATCKTCHPNDPSGYTCFGCHRHTPANIVARHEGQTLQSLADCIRCHPQGRQGDN